jgi:hypothetical protein
MHYQRVRDDFANRYGAPVSEDKQTFAGGAFTITQARWLLKSTDLRCTETDYANKPERDVSVTYRRRQATPF